MSTDPTPPAQDDALLSALDLVGNLTDHPLSDIPRHGDSRSGEVYIVTDEIVTALKVALLTGRPLLLGGPPGCGKSSLASYVARNLGVEYYEYVTTDDARASQLTWQLDTVRRLGDAQAGKLADSTGNASIAPYIEPGPLWWALDRTSATKRGLEDADGFEPASYPELLTDHEVDKPGAVLLIDEVDKADSSFCNGLLVPLGSRQAFVPPVGVTVRPSPDAPSWSPLTIITTNNERDLPEAFLRRCVVLRLPGPGADQLTEIVGRHFRDLRPELRDVIADLADQVAGDPDDDRPVSTAEFLDLVKVVVHLTDSGQLDKERLEIVKRVTLDKHRLYGRRDRIWSR